MLDILNKFFDLLSARQKKDTMAHVRVCLVVGYSSILKIILAAFRLMFELIGQFDFSFILWFLSETGSVWNNVA